MKNATPPKTRLQGEAHAIQMLRELEQMNTRSNKPMASAKHVDKRIRECIGWAPDARRGFTFVVGEWLRTEVQGMGYNLDLYEAAFRRDKRAPSK